MRIAPQALPFALTLGLVSLALGLVWRAEAALPMAAVFVFVLWFFRDPERRPPRDGDVLLAPADGKVIQAGPRRLSIFMNVFNVHVCRSPMAGRVDRVEHRPGRFMAAFHDAAADHNERTSIVLVGEGRRVSLSLVAGLVARRIVCPLTPGQVLSAGQRIGLIQFGSRVDLDLPATATPTVGIGARVRAGETIVARLGAGSADDSVS